MVKEILVEICKVSLSNFKSHGTKKLKGGGEVSYNYMLRKIKRPFHRSFVGGGCWNTGMDFALIPHEFKMIITFKSKY